MKKVVIHPAIYHVIFWLGYILLFSAANSSLYAYSDPPLDSPFQAALFDIILVLPIKMLAVYFTIYVLIEKLLFKKRSSEFILWTLVSMIVVVLLERSLVYYVIDPRYKFAPQPHHLLNPLQLISTLVNTYLIVFLAAIIKYYHQRVKKEQQDLKKSMVSLETKLRYMKTQTHPHFLFNTLNNLYALCLSKSDDAPEVVTHLSDLLSYLFYEYSEPAVSLEHELQLINSYIYLEKLRYGNRIDIEVTSEGDYKNKQIVPLLLIPFVDNSFKHGASTVTHPWIRINFKAGPDNQFYFEIKNNHKNGSSSPIYKLETIGITNVVKRLELFYPGKYKLDINPQEEFFTVKLQLSLQF